MKKLLRRLIPSSLKEIIYKFKKERRKNLYKGNRVICSICNSSFREFAPFGRIKRTNAACHECDSLERHRLIWKYLNDKDLINKRLTILHFAPEKVFYDIFSTTNNHEYVPCDLYPEVYTYTSKHKVLKADITNIPFESNHFDFILCNHVLEHIPDDHRAMSELFRVMKPGGFGIFQVPIDYNREKTYEDFSITSPEGREKAFGQNDHVRWYGRDYKDRLRKVGFQVIEDDYVNSFTKEERYKYGFEEAEMIYYCRKMEGGGV